MSIDTAMERLRAANPAPDTRLLRDESDDLTALLAATWQRSTNMQTKQPTNQEPVNHQKTRGWVIALAAAAVVLVVVGIASFLSTRQGTEPADATPSVDMTGTWRGDTTDFREFNADASYRIALAEAMENSVVDQGDYTVDGVVLRQSSNGESAVCADGETATYTIESLDDGANGEERVLLVLSDDQCARRAADGDLTLIRLK
jgi:hypothetical protein